MIKLWNAGTGVMISTLQGHTGSVTSTVFSKDGALLFSASQDKTIRVWDVQTGKTIRTIAGATAPLTALSLTPDGNTIAAGSWTGIMLWNSGTGKWARTLEGRLSFVRSAAFSPDGKTLACATGNNIKVWDNRSGALIHTLIGHSSVINALAFSPDGKKIASAGADKIVKIWDVARHKSIRDLTGHISNVTAVAFSPDGRFVASGSVDKTIRLCDADTGKLVRIFEGHVTLISALAFAPDGKTFATGSYDNSIRIWDVAGGKTLFTLTGHISEVTGVAFNSTGTMLASSSRDKSVRLWDTQSGKFIRTLEGNTSDVFAVAFSPVGNLVVSGGFDKTLRLWDPQTGKLVRTFEGHSGPVSAVSFSLDGKFIVSGSEDASAKIWSPDQSQALSTLVSFNEGEDWLVVTPEGLFDGSPEAWRSILWRFAANTFDVAPVEAFFNEFYYPGVLADVLAGKKPRSVQNIAQVDRRQPAVKLDLIDSPVGAKGISSRKIRVRVQISEAPADATRRSGSGARDVRLFRNGALIKAWRGDVLNSQPSVTLEETISIVAGPNDLTAYAFNKDNIKSADATLRLNGSDSLKRKGVAYVVIVGVDEYENPQYNLKYAVADAQTFGETFRAAQNKLGTFAKFEVISLFNKDATRANVLSALNRLSGNTDGASGGPAVLNRIKPAEPEDAVVIYFAGHGTAQKARFYLIPHDLGYTGPFDALDSAGLSTMLAHSISDRELEQALEHIDASGLLLVIDACNSGQALESEEKRRGPMNSKGLAQLAYEKGIYVLTAAQGYQAALEAVELGHGFLTYALVEDGLRNGAADRDKDQTILIREWLDYAVDRVPEMQTAALAGPRGLKIVFAPGEERISDPTQRNVQRPRVFYRREVEPQPLIVEKVGQR